MRIIRYLVRLYLSKFPITEGKKHVYRFAQKYLLPEDRVINSMTRHGFYLKLNLNNPEHQYYYFYKSHDERYEVNNLQKIIQKDYICWDIGANIGFYSFLLASIVDSGKIFSFEPIVKTYKDLDFGKKMNNFEHVILNNFALGLEKTSQRIFFNDDDLCAGTASFVESDQFDNSELVEVDTIDRIVNSVLVPDFIKIDVEGFQVQVVKGGLDFFKQNSPLIMIEIDKDTNQWLEDYFIGMGYQFYKFNKKSLTRVDSIFNNGRNILFCKPGSQYMERIEERVQ
jgi:FkbM family methyltransferase